MSEFARRGGIDPSSVSKVLSGKQNPGKDFYLAIARAFDVSIESIERLDKDGITPEQLPPDAALGELMTVAKKLPPDKLQTVLEFAFFELERSKPENT